MSEVMGNKSKAIKDAIESIFPGTSDAIKNHRCPTCGKAITPFRNKASEKEYYISGMCQSCQDEVFQ